MYTKNINNKGVGFLGILTIVFITLKLTGYIEWLWFWVLAPLWVPFAIVFLMMIIAIVLHLLFKLISKFKRN